MLIISFKYEASVKILQKLKARLKQYRN